MLDFLARHTTWARRIPASTPDANRRQIGLRDMRWKTAFSRPIARSGSGWPKNRAPFSGRALRRRGNTDRGAVCLRTPRTHGTPAQSPALVAPAALSPTRAAGAWGWL